MTLLRLAAGWLWANPGWGCRRLGVWGGIVVGWFGALLLRNRIWLLKTFFRRQLGIRLAVANGKCCTILVERLVALILDVVNASQIDVRPGQHTGILREPDRLSEVVLGYRNIAVHNGDPGQNEVGSRRIARFIGDRLLRQRSGAIGVAFH